MRIKAIIKLFGRIITRGKFRHSTLDDTSRRLRVLTHLHAILPSFPAPVSRRKIVKSPYLEWWIGQAAFIHSALHERAGHLSVTDGHLAYIRIPKAASSAVCFLLLKANAPVIGQMDPSPETINYLADMWLQKRLTLADSDRTFFTVVRNPFSRIVSFYRSFFERGDEKHFIYAVYLFGIFQREMSFREFIRLVEIIPDKLKDQHLKPQYSFLKAYERRNVRVRVFKLEDPDPLNTFLSEYGLILDAVNKSFEPYDYRDYYDEETLELVNNIYRNDISMFGYGAQYDDLRRFLSADPGGRQPEA